MNGDNGNTSGDPKVRAGQCHCGAVRFEVTLSDGFNSIRRCTCSYCRMRGAVVAMAESGGIKILQGEDALTTYRFHTGAAQHFFCSRCGIYTPSSTALRPEPLCRERGVPGWGQPLRFLRGPRHGRRQPHERYRQADAPRRKRSASSRRISRRCSGASARGGAASRSARPRPARSEPRSRSAGDGLNPGRIRRSGSSGWPAGNS